MPAAARETRRFARRLLAAMSVIVALVVAAGIVTARGQLGQAQAEEADRGHRAEFAAAQALLRLRREALADRARALAGRPRIHAALEDDALDLLYLAADDELRDLFAPAPDAGAVRTLRARFYRFLDARGRLIPPVSPTAPGEASADELAALAPARLDRWPAYGAVISAAGEGPDRASELLAVPVVSRETGRLLGVLVLGFAVDLAPADSAHALWVDGRLHAPGLAEPIRADLARRLAGFPALRPDASIEELELAGRPHRLEIESVNAGEAYPAVHRIRLVALDGLIARQRAITWQITAAGVFLVLAGCAVSGLLTLRFSGWFGRLARDSETQRALRSETETRLDRTSAELARAARFAADASHQLKTPVAVLRLGLEELGRAGGAAPPRGEAVGELLRQTDRLAHILDTLLLLSRLDAGILRVRAGTVDLAAVAATALDDASMLPAAEALDLDNQIAGSLPVPGEERYLTVVLQNLLENAVKYNRPGGRVRLWAGRAAGNVALRVANTAPHPVPPEAWERIFERFHRGEAGGDTPGYGLGLDLARHLARLHGGDVRLLGSDAEWTVFEFTLPETADG